MPPCVGAGVGYGVGWSVGAGVGLSVGACVGAAVGLSLGCLGIIFPSAVSSRAFMHCVQRAAYSPMSSPGANEQ